MKQLKLILTAIPAAFGRLFALFGFFAFFAVVAAKGGGGNFNFRRAFGAACLSVILGIGNAAFAAAGPNATGERNATSERIDIASHNKYRNWSKAQLNKRDPHGWTPMHRAATKGDRRTVEQILGRGADTEITTGKTGETALHLAARYGRADVANVLLKAGANLEAKDNEGKTPLHHAARHTNTANVLLKAGANIKAKDKDGRTPLHWAMQAGEVPLVRALLEAGADKEAKDNNGWTPLQMAVDLGYRNFTNALLDAVGKADKSFANRADSGKMAPLNHAKMTPLHHAAVNNNARRASALIKVGADLNRPDDHGMRPLHYAARNNSIEALYVILKAGADPTTKSIVPHEHLPIDAAKRKGNHKAAGILQQAMDDKRRRECQARYGWYMQVVGLTPHCP